MPFHEELAQVKLVFIFPVKGISHDAGVIFKNGGPSSSKASILSAI